MRHRLPLILVLLLAAFLLFFNLGSSSLHTWDEAGHALVSREILDTGQWHSLQLDGVPYLKKTPIKFWLTALTFKTFGINEWTVRIWSTVFAFATIVVLCLLGDRVFGRHVGVTAGLILVTSHQYLYKHCARTGDVDSYLIFFWTAAMLLLLRSLQQRSRPMLYSSFLAIGLCGMVKHLGQVPLILLIVILFLALSSEWKVFPLRTWLTALSLPLLVILPWTLVQLWMHGGLFLDVHFGREVVSRAAEGLPGTPASELGSGYYADTLKNGMFPWSLLAPFALVWAWRRRKEINGSDNLLLLIWIGVVLLTAVAGAGLAHRYILPAYPALALLIGQMLVSLLGERRSRLPAAAVFAGVVVALLSTTTAATHNAFTINDRETMLSAHLFGRLAGPEVSLVIWLSAAALALTAFFAWKWRDRISVIRVALVTLTAIAIYQVAIPLRISDHRHNFDLTVRAAIELQRQGTPVWTGLPNRYSGPPFYRFYLRLLEPDVWTLPANPPPIARRLRERTEPVVLLGTDALVRGVVRTGDLTTSHSIEEVAAYGHFEAARLTPHHN